MIGAATPGRTAVGVVADSVPAGTVSPSKSESCASTLKVAVRASGAVCGELDIGANDGSMRAAGASGMKDFCCDLAKNPSVSNAAGDGFCGSALR